MAKESRIASILGEWVEARDRGEVVDPEELIAAHPELAGELRRRFRALSLMEEAVGDEPPPGRLRPLPDDRYSEFRVTGEGGMGIVYWALDTDLNRQVAFKVVRPNVGARRGEAPPLPLAMSPPALDTPASKAFETLKARFLQEAWVTAGLEHPGIVPVYELGETKEGVPYYTMRFVRGSQTLASAIEEMNGKPIDQRLALLEPFLRVCDTIRYAHAHGVIHRDLKPENVAIGEFGEVVVLDWGLAKMRDQEDSAAKTWQERLRAYRNSTDLQTIASAMGTPGYMAPEAALGRIAELDERCDVYSLGAILFEILTGRLPFAFRTYVDLVMKVTEEDAPSASNFDRTVPESLSAICAKALARDKDIRHASVDALAEEIRTWQLESVIRSEVRAFLVEAEQALASAEGLSGDAFFQRLDRATLALGSVLQRRPGHARAARLKQQVEDVRKLAIEERERAVKDQEERAKVELLRKEREAREELLLKERDSRAQLVRRMSAAVLLLLVVASGAAVWVVESRRRAAQDALAEAEFERNRAEEERIAREIALSEAEAERNAKQSALLEAEAQSDARLEALADVLRLSDVKKVRDLLAEANALWPVHPDRAGAMADWMARVVKVLTGRAVHEATLASLRKRALPHTEEEWRGWRFADPADSWQHDVLADLLAGMGKLADGEDAVLRTVAERKSLAASIRDRSITKLQAEWERAVAEIADEGASPSYGGLKIEPILGLVPLGKDPDSGLLEFAHVGSGTIPRREEETGRLIYEEDAAIVLILIPGGTFNMGAQADNPSAPNHDPWAETDESPVREVTVRPYLLAKHECTQAQWAAMTGGGRPSMYGLGAVVWDWKVTDRHPVEQVSWNEATRWLNRHRIRLPSEAEWEYACRAGTDTPWVTGREVAELGMVANILDAYCKSHGGMPSWNYTLEVYDGHKVHAPVGRYRANAFGLFDMHGNVSEWCKDWPGPYYDAPVDGSAASRRKGYRGPIFRGGSWRSSAWGTRSANRNCGHSSFRIDYLGLRPAMSLP